MTHFQFDTDVQIKNNPSNVKAIRFPIEPFGEITHTLRFGEMLDPAEAIRHAENYLSQPIPEEHFRIVFPNLFDQFFLQLNKQPLGDWREEMKKWKNKTKGDLLEDTYLIKEISNEDGTLILECG